MSLLELFCHVDGFCHTFLPQWDQALRAHGERSRRRAGRLAPSEVMTIMIHFHQVRFRDFKTYYLVYVLGHLRREFPRAVSYQRFVELIPSLVGPLCAYLQTCYGQCSGLSFVDSTPLAVCHNRRIPQHRVFRNVAERGKTSMGWFYGFKLHVVINHHGELLACQLTPGNVDDRRPVRKLAERLWGRLFGDKGYLSAPLTRELLTTRRVRLVTHLKRNMANRLLLLHEKVILRRRALLETVFDQLKHLLQIEHTRHRSPTNFAVNVLAGLIAYCHQPTKPSICRGGRPQLTAIPN
ncbi:MAG: IS982 family transposase [Chloroflexota bacterium]|nr:IS982 family transposase [Chloroflexota bacterium]